MASHSLQPTSPGNLVDITPVNWHRYPAPITAAMLAEAYIEPVIFTGGLQGDDVALATANSTTPILPATQTAKAAFPGAPNSVVPSESTTSGQVITAIADYTFATDITAPRGFIGPKDAYPVVGYTPPAAPVITSLAPNTAVAGGPDIVVTINGTGFTQWTKVLNGGVQNMTASYISPTKMAMMFEVSSSVAGVVAVIAVDHSVASAASNFTFT
jgi:hypothetical protein